MDKLSFDKATRMKQYFSRVSIEFMQMVTFQEFEKGVVFIRENEPVDKVFFLLEGKAHAIDYRVFGIEYVYMYFEPIRALGAMELLLNLDVYQATIITDTPSTMMVVDKNTYWNWLCSDINAFHLETAIMGQDLLMQGKRERVFLFLHGIDRLYLVFLQYYELSGEEDLYVLDKTRKELSRCSGLSEKTVNRAVAQMENGNYIGRRGNKITINRKQYSKIREYVSNKINLDDDYAFSTSKGFYRIPDDEI